MRVELAAADHGPEGRAAGMRRIEITMRKLCWLFMVLVAFTFSSVLRASEPKTDVTDRLDSATSTLEQITSTPDKGIPKEVLSGAKCIAVVPKLIKAGFVLGGKHGRGVATCRQPDGSWSAPAFFSISGGSWGAQIGAEDVQLVMMIMNNEGMQNLLKDKFQVGGSVSASAGPVGRHASAGTDWKANTAILTYSRSKGIFAGIDLGGSWIQADKESTEALYGKDLPTSQILTGNVPTPTPARAFVAEVRKVEATNS
jgi:SH3 domain-containing YSC84-like protein 1